MNRCPGIGDIAGDTGGNSQCPLDSACRLNLAEVICTLKARATGGQEMSQNTPIFEVESVGPILVVVPQRHLMTVRDAELRDAYNNAYRLLSQDTIDHLVIDLEHLEYFSSTFVGILIRLARKTQGSNGATVLTNLNDEVRRILKQLMLLENPNTEFLWTQMDTREAGIQWLQAEYGLPDPS